MNLYQDLCNAEMGDLTVILISQIYNVVETVLRDYVYNVHICFII